MDKHRDFDVKAYYDNLHLSDGILFLYSNRLLMQTGTGLLAVFIGVFFYEKFNESFTAVMLVFAAMYGASVFLNPLSAMLLDRLGSKKMLITSVMFLPLSYIALMLWDKNPNIALSAFLVAVVLYRVLYWIPYHIDFAKFTDKKDRGKQMSLLLNISELILTLTPLAAGFVIALFGFNYLFGVAVIIFLFALIPLFFVEETCEKYSFKYFETFSHLFKKENRSMLIAYFGDGMQSAVRIAIWPIFIYLLLKGDYKFVGFVTSLTVVLLIMIRFVLGNLEDKMDRKKMLQFGSFLSTTGWLLKVFIETGFQIFIIDSYHKVGRAVNRLTFDVATYDQAAGNGHYIDEFTVLKDIATNFGRAAVLLSAIWLAASFGITATFIFAAGATLLMTLLNKNVYLQ